MSKLSVHDTNGAAVAEIEFPDELLTKKGQQAIHDAVVAYRAGLRAGSASTLGKGAVAGSGKKPWRQKGTGRARAGYRQSPVWRGGGVAHGPHPRSYAKKISQKAAQLAFRSAFSDMVREGRLRVVEQLAITEPKTKAATRLLVALGIDNGALILVDKLDKNVICSVRNLPNVEATTVDSVSTYQLLQYPVAILTREAMARLQARLAGGVGRKS